MIFMVRSRDHLPPHVHVLEETEKWEARFRFSFLCNTVSLYSLEAYQSGKPSSSDLDDAITYIKQNITVYRDEWIHKNPYTGLVYMNKTIKKNSDGTVTIGNGVKTVTQQKKRNKSRKGKRKKSNKPVPVYITHESYNNGVVTFILSNGVTETLKSDAGHKEDFK
ncbi:hypothetical protein JK182_01340 [Acetobacter okinawensis]|uniref:hypothetical protein n=1 Tax=Acetobacter okinawensis TaxID=1076594 RepID=UPI001BAA90AD|nr:hypothetical protein [Acetobacter okinawensis]MBS0987336.1 hypothetical protein [Acetobacter okinawensis]